MAIGTIGMPGGGQEREIRVGFQFRSRNGHNERQ